MFIPDLRFPSKLLKQLLQPSSVNQLLFKRIHCEAQQFISILAEEDQGKLTGSTKITYY